MLHYFRRWLTGSKRHTPFVKRRQPLVVEPLEDRLAPANISVVPVWDAERLDPNSDHLVNYFGGVPIAQSGAALTYDTSVTHSGTGAYRIQTNAPLAVNTGAFVQITVGGSHAPLNGQPYVDTRDLSYFEKTEFWIKNTTGSAFSLLFEIKDYADSNNQRAIYSQAIGAGNAWTLVSVPLDVTPANGWTILGNTPDLTRTRFLAFTIQANQGVPVNGSVFLDDMTATARGGVLDSQAAPINDLVDRVARQQFNALWGARDRGNGLVPSLSVFADQMGLNATAGLIKMLPGAISRGWVTTADAHAYVLQVVSTLNSVMNARQLANNGGYLPPRLLDRVSLQPLGTEESSVDAALLSLSLYQYKAQANVSQTARTTIENFINRFAWDQFAGANGWTQAYQYNTQSFTGTYDTYSSEVWTISLAAHLTQGTHHVDITSKYNTGIFRSATTLVNATPYEVGASPAFRAPFMQWLFPLWVDVAQRGKDTYSPANEASNPFANAVLYQQDVDAYFATKNRALFLQRDAGDDGSGNNYRAFSAFNDTDSPDLFMPWSDSFAFLGDPTAAAAALRNTLGNQLDGPLGLADSTQWTAGNPAPTSITPRTDFWNLSLSTWALLEYRYHDSQYLSSLSEVQQALDLVFKGLIITKNGSTVNVGEGGIEDTFTVRLSSVPAPNVTVTLTTNGQVRTSPTTLTFTSITWNIPQTVTVMAVDDAAVEGRHSDAIHFATASADGDYNNVNVPDVAVNIMDNDADRTAQEFLTAAVDRYNRSDDPADFGQAMVPLFTDYYAGGTYGTIEPTNVTFDANDPDAARGASSLKLNWDGAGANGYLQFDISPNIPNRPRDIADFGIAHSVHFQAKGDVAGRQVQMLVFKTIAGPTFQQVASQWFTLTTSFADYALALPADLRPQDLWAVQFLMDTGHDAGGGSVWLDNVRIACDGFDPLRLPQSYPAPNWAPTGSPANSPQLRDNIVYPNRAFLYDVSLLIKSLIAFGDAGSLQRARNLADATLATAPNGQAGYFNARNAGHVLNADGSPRDSLGLTKTLGDNSWFGLALLDVYQITGDAAYLTAARDISDWAEANLRAVDAFKGYKGGYDDAGAPLAYRATEHNIDCYLLNAVIAKVLTRLGDAAAGTYAARATYAGDFVVSMFDGIDGKFWTGTRGLPVDLINTDSVPTDVQFWSFETLGQSVQYHGAVDWSRPIAWAEANLVQTDGALTGFTFSTTSTANRVWLEGTAHALVAYRLLGNQAKAEQAIQTLQRASMGGGVLAASSDALHDGVLGADYDARVAVAPTAWTALGRVGRSPFDVFRLFADDFSRANAATPGSAWLTPLGSAPIASNHIALPATGTNIAVVANLYAADVSVQADVSVPNNTTAGAGLIARYTGPGDTNGYLGLLHGVNGVYTAYLFLLSNGNYRLLASRGGVAGAGTLRFDVLGNSLKLFLNDTLLLNELDNTIPTAGLCGVRGNAATFDNFLVSRMQSALSFKDNFNRTIGADLGSNYVKQGGGSSIEADKLSLPANAPMNSPNLVACTAVFAADVSVQAEVSVPNVGTVGAGLLARYTGTSDTNYYLGLLHGVNGVYTAYIFSRIGAGNFNQLAAVPAGSGAGTLRFDVVGASLKLYLNNQLAAAAVDTALAGPGLTGVRGNGTTFDNFTASPYSAPLAFTDGFNRSNSSLLGNNFDELAGDPAIAANQLAMNATLPNLAIYNGLAAADVAVQADVNVPGNVNGGAGAGLVARYAGPGDANLYLGLLHGVNGAFTAYLFARTNGNFNLLASVPAPAGVGTLRFEVIGNSLKLLLGGAQLLNIVDNTIQGPGLAGVRGNSSTFDNFTATRLFTPLSAGDAFNRPNNPDPGVAYTKQLGDATITSNQLSLPAAGPNVAVHNGLFAADVSVQADVTVPNVGTAGAGLVARYTGPGDANLYLGLLYGVNGVYTAYIFVRTNGNFVQLAAVPTASGAGALRFDLLGNSLRLFLNGALLASVVDNTIQGPGLTGVRGNSTTFDNFTATRLLSTASFSDGFNRAASSDLGSSFVEQAGDLSITGSKLSTPATGPNLAAYTGLFAADVAVQADINLPGAGVAGAGLVLRYSGPADNNYYLGLLYRSGGTLTAYIFVQNGGTFTQLDARTVANGAGTLRFEARGKSLTLSLDGAILASAIDAAIQAPGLTGVRGVNTTFDNFIADQLGL